MLKQTCMLGLLAASAFGLVSAPAQAGEASADSIQRSEQTSSSVGVGNQIRQESFQLEKQGVNATSIGEEEAEADADAVQQSNQTAATVGDLNEISQENQQMEQQQAGATEVELD